MTILEYYIEKQKDVVWYRNFQSISDKCNGKMFDFIDTNFRKLMSFCSQLDAFKTKNGKSRSEWNTMDCGQEEDKHRVVNLKNAGLIICENNKYFITEKGYEVLRVYNDENLTDKEKWILIFMLVSDYRVGDKSPDIVYKSLLFAETMSQFGLDQKKLIEILRKAHGINKKDLLFQTDIFWLITFYKDKDFIRLFVNSSEDDKKNLSQYVISCSKNIKSNDCIAHKFVSSGAYSANTFNEDINIILCVLIVIGLNDKTWNSFLKVVCQFYLTAKFEKITSFMSNNIVIYEEIYKNAYINNIN